MSKDVTDLIRELADRNSLIFDTIRGFLKRLEELSKMDGIEKAILTESDLIALCKKHFGRKAPSFETEQGKDIVTSPSVRFESVDGKIYWVRVVYQYLYPSRKYIYYLRIN